MQQQQIFHSRVCVDTVDGVTLCLHHWCVTLMLCRLQVTAIETAVSETDVFAFSTRIYDIITLAVDNEEFVFFKISAYDCRTGYTTTGRGSTAPVYVVRVLL